MSYFGLSCTLNPTINTFMYAHLSLRAGEGEGVEIGLPYWKDGTEILKIKRGQRVGCSFQQQKEDVARNGAGEVRKGRDQCRRHCRRRAASPV